MKNKNLSGQAAILIVFVIGMVSLLIGMSLSKTGFQESMMGRNIAGSTKAFYAANSGIEDVLITMGSISSGDLPYKYNLIVDDDNPGYEVKANVEIKSETETEIEEGVFEKKREIISTGTYGNFIRKIKVTVKSTLIQPDFTRFIQAGNGGIQIGQNVKISSLVEDEFINVSSKSFLLGRNNSASGSECTNASSGIIGNVFAGDKISKLGTNGSGPCIAGNAYAKSLDYCRVLGAVFSEEDPSINCPYDRGCDINDDPNCKLPDIDNLTLPDIGINHIEDHLEAIENIWNRDCVIDGGTNDCSTLNDDGSSTIGNMIIEGDLETNSNSILKLSGHIWVKGNVTFDSNQKIEIDPTYKNDSSLILLADGKINTSANTHFYSDIFEDINRYLLVASKYGSEDLVGGICEGASGDNAIFIEPNVQSILFYAMQGCAYIQATASEEFLGAILAEGVYIDNNVVMKYDSNLKNAKFYLGGEGGWKILSFTEV